MQNGELEIPSNVTRISRAIKPETSDGVQQIIYYQEGLGTDGLPVSRFVAGTFGQGLGANVREAYSFLATNYEPGDEIYLLGFSRGAFTARSVASFVGQVGLLTKRGLRYLSEIWHDVQHQWDDRYRPRNPDSPFPNKPSARNPAYREELYRRGMTDLDVTVKAIGVWDTVGSLGIPRVGWLQRIGLQGGESDRMQFYDTKLSNAVENAFQALALDENRSAFSPAVWEKAPGNRTNLRQVWFPGVHSNIGGGYDDQGLANITLAWMMAQLTPYIEFYRDYVVKQEEDNIRYYRGEHKRVRPWSFAKIYDSITGIYNVGGRVVRTPGRYYATDPNDSTKRLDRPLRNTNEYMHASVRTRIRLKGPGMDDKDRYEPESMDAWKLVVDYPDGRDAKPNIYWRARFRSEDVSTRTLPEAPLWGVELDLLGMDSETEDYVLHPPPTRPQRGDRGDDRRMSGALQAEAGAVAGAVAGVPGARHRDDRLVRRDAHREDRGDGKFELVVRGDRGPRPRVEVLMDEKDDRGGKRIIEETYPDGRKKIIEERYEIRRLPPAGPA